MASDQIIEKLVNLALTNNFLHHPLGLAEVLPRHKITDKFLLSVEKDVGETTDLYAFVSDYHPFKNVCFRTLTDSQAKIIIEKVRGREKSMIDYADHVCIGMRLLGEETVEELIESGDKSRVWVGKF